MLEKRESLFRFIRKRRWCDGQLLPFQWFASPRAAGCALIQCSCGFIDERRQLLSAPNVLAFTERFCFLDPKHSYLRLFGQPQLPAARRKQVGSGDCGETLAHCSCPLPAPFSVRLDGESLAGTPISSNQGLVHTQLGTSQLSPFKISSGLESSGEFSAPCPGSLAV
jgi:hypothetical protein